MTPSEWMEHMDKAMLGKNVPVNRHTWHYLSKSNATGCVFCVLLHHTSMTCHSNVATYEREQGKNYFLKLQNPVSEGLRILHSHPAEK
jgi:hypothetical protein